MASYTMQLREYIESFSQESETLSNNERIKIGREKLFDFKYPIFDPDYKAVFETNFIRNFYMREIGFESEGLFKFQLETWLLINMPYYNKLFESELIKFNPLESYSLKTTYQKVNDVNQNDTRTKQQNDNKNITQNDLVTGQMNESETKNQNDINTHTQNDRNVKTQNDSRNIDQNDETSLIQNGNTVTDTMNTQLENANRDSVNETENNVESTSEKEGKGKTIDTHDNFSREINSDTPDTRLQLTSKDGEGVIEYASEIKENNQNNETTSENETEEIQKDVSDSKGISTTTDTTESSIEGDSHSDTTVKNDELGSLKSNTSDRLNSNINDTLDRNATDSLRSDVKNDKSGSTRDALERSVKDDLISNINDTGKTTINDIEDYIEEKVGSIGVKTYSEMITEYRESLLRIEKQMFKEMNQLFMLVY